MRFKKVNALIYLFSLYIGFFIFMLILLFFATYSHAQSLSFLSGGVTNNKDNQRSFAWQAEYEYKSVSPFAVSLSYLNEGHNDFHKRDGAIIQGKYYLPIPSDRLDLSLGIGCYRWYDTQTTEVVKGIAGVFGVNASYKLTDKVSLRAQWERIDSNDHRDSDVFLMGLGYNWR